MAYSVSKHRRHFELQINEIIKKLRLGTKNDVPTGLREFAVAAAIFLAHAEVENFFINVLDDLANAFSANANDPSKLSSKLRAHLVCNRFGMDQIASKMAAKVGEQDVLNFIERWFVSTELPLISGSGPMVAVTGVDIYGDYSYPSSKNIERVLRRIGIGNPKGALNSVGKKDVVGILESVGSLRTALAHSAVLPGVSVGDVIQRLISLKQFTRAFDRLLYTNATKSISHSAWKASLC
jgi:hypothetical protein